MDQNTALPPQLQQSDLLDQSKKNEEKLKDVVGRLNEQSSEYRNTRSLIDEKIIFLAAGTISLIFTFVGILFNSHRDLSSVRFIFVFLSVYCFMFTIVLLLLARWLWSSHVFTIVHRHYLKMLKQKNSTEQKITENASNVVTTEYKYMTEAELKETVKEHESYGKKIDSGITSNEKKEKIQEKWAKGLAIGGYAGMLVGYLFLSIFFIDLVQIITS